MTVHVIGVPMDLGSGHRGVDMGPSALRIAGIAERLRELGHRVVDDGNLFVRNMEELRPGDATVRYLKEITRSATILSKRVDGILTRGGFPIVLGGDHSIAIGTISGIAEHCRRKRKKLSPFLD